MKLLFQQNLKKKALFQSEFGKSCENTGPDFFKELKCITNISNRKIFTYGCIAWKLFKWVVPDFYEPQWIIFPLFVEHPI